MKNYNVSLEDKNRILEMHKKERKKILSEQDDLPDFEGDRKNDIAAQKKQGELQVTKEGMIKQGNTIFSKFNDEKYVTEYIKKLGGVEEYNGAITFYSEGQEYYINKIWTFKNITMDPKAIDIISNGEIDKTFLMAFNNRQMSEE